MCNPVPPGDGELVGWRNAVRGVENLIRNGGDSPWQIAEVLARVAATGRLGSDAFGTRAAAIVVEEGPEDWQDGRGLIGAVCAMCGMSQLLKSQRLTAKAGRRNAIAGTLWSALSFQPPLAEPMLERLRQELLDCARRASLKMALEDRKRVAVKPRGRAGEMAQENRALRRNADLDREEIDLLRWILADRSTLLERDYCEVDGAESGVLARGLEVGLMVRRFPSIELYEFASQDLPQGEDLSLSVLVERLGEDRKLLAEPFRGNPQVEQCPSGFPLLTALEGSPMGGAACDVKRSRADWCGRALLEGAVAMLPESAGGAGK